MTITPTPADELATIVEMMKRAPWINVADALGSDSRMYFRPSEWRVLLSAAERTAALELDLIAYGKQVNELQKAVAAAEEDRERMEIVGRQHQDSYDSLKSKLSAAEARADKAERQRLDEGGTAKAAMERMWEATRACDRAESALLALGCRQKPSGEWEIQKTHDTPTGLRSLWVDITAPDAKAGTP